MTNEYVLLECLHLEGYRVGLSLHLTLTCLKVLLLDCSIVSKHLAVSIGDMVEVVKGLPLLLKTVFYDSGKGDRDFTMPTL